MGFFAALIGPVVETVGGIFTSREETKQIRAETEVRRLQAKADRDIAKIEADTAVEIARGQAAAKMDENIQDYDLQVLKNRERSITDDVLIYSLFVLFGMHFFEPTQPYMEAGWIAMGYDGVPWWFEFAIVTAIVSTLGGMRVLKLFSEGLVGKIRGGK